MTTAITATRPVATRWEPDVHMRCDRCLGTASARHLRRLDVHGRAFDVCVCCLEYLGRQDVHDRAIALRRLYRTYAGAA